MQLAEQIFTRALTRKHMRDITVTDLVEAGLSLGCGLDAAKATAHRLYLQALHWMVHASA